LGVKGLNKQPSKYEWLSGLSVAFWTKLDIGMIFENCHNNQLKKLISCHNSKLLACLASLLG
jgi:hypothetical protein